MYKVQSDRRQSFSNSSGPWLSCQCPALHKGSMLPHTLLHQAPQKIQPLRNVAGGPQSQQITQIKPLWILALSTHETRWQNSPAWLS